MQAININSSNVIEMSDKASNFVTFDGAFLLILFKRFLFDVFANLRCHLRVNDIKLYIIRSALCFLQMIVSFQPVA